VKGKDPLNGFDPFDRLRAKAGSPQVENQPQMKDKRAAKINQNRCSVEHRKWAV